MEDYHSQLSIIPQVYESAVLNDDLEHRGGITLAWNASDDTEIPVGSYITFEGTRYVLLDPYRPNRQSAVHFRYEPQFKHPVNLLDRIPFWVTSLDSAGHVMDMHTISFTGYPEDIIQKFVAFFSDYAVATGDTFFAATIGTSWTYDIKGVTLDKAVITVSFDGCTIKSAATAIANAMSCNVFFDWSAKTVRFIGGTTISGETYNSFHVLGGTTNMGKVAKSGGYSAMTQRLTLDSTAYPGSMIMTGAALSGGIRLVKELVFDEIYPKMELYVKSVRERRCYLTDENGMKIADHWEKEGEPVDVDTPGAVAVYKEYSKWYIRLTSAKCDTEEEYASATDYGFSKANMINDKPLTLLFQPVYGPGPTSPLAGRSFELVAFTTSTPEWGDDDVLDRTTPFVAQEGEYRIIVQAEGESLLPSVSEALLIPHVGNKVTLVNVALGEEEESRAKTELADAALEIISLMTNRIAEHGETVVVSPTDSVKPHVGMSTGVLEGEIVTSISRNIDTGITEVGYGSWNSRKSITGSLSDRIEVVSAGSSKATENDASQSVPPSLTQEQLEALLKTTKKSDALSEINTLGVDLAEVMEQSDRQFNIHFGYGEPTLLNQPAVEWETDEERVLHLQDIYYDVTREAASPGGRSWRFVFAEGVYRWDEITDMDTRAALVKIADVANDGILSAGTEKSRILVDWLSVVAEYVRNVSRATSYGVSTTAYEHAFGDLADMLNGGDEWDGDGLPLWLGDLVDSDIRLSDYDVEPDDYREAWEAYYNERVSLLASINAAVKAVADATVAQLAAITSDGMLTTDELPQLRKEFETEYRERSQMIGQVTDGTTHTLTAGSFKTATDAYLTAFKALVAYMQMGIQEWTEPATYSVDMEHSTYIVNSKTPLSPVSPNNDFPLMLQLTTGVKFQEDWSHPTADGDGGNTFRQLWVNLLEKKMELSASISNHIESVASSKMQVFTGSSDPTGYKVGDLWIKPDDGASVIYYCRSVTGNVSTDWSKTGKEFAEGVQRIIAEMAVELEDVVKWFLEYIEEDEDNAEITLFLAEATGCKKGDIKYDGDDEDENYFKYYDEYGEWNNFGSNEDIPSVSSEARALLDRLTAYLTGTKKLRFCRSMKTEGMTYQTYDVYMLRSTFFDKMTGRDMEAGLNVWVYGSNGWEKIMEDTTGMLENYGNQILTTVYGTDDISQMSGLDIRKNFAQLFAYAADPDCDPDSEDPKSALKAKAGITVRTVNEGTEEHPDYRGYVDIEGTFRSQDGRFRIEGEVNTEYTEEDGELLADNTFTCLEMGELNSSKNAMEIGYIYDYLGAGASKTDPFVKMCGVDIGRNGNIDEHHAYMTPQAFGCEKYHIVYTETTEVDGEQVVDEQFLPGVGTVDYPVTFTSADGKTVTVIGGIITDVS